MNAMRYLVWLGLVGWIGVVAVMMPLAGKAGDVYSNDPTLALPRDAEATRALVRERLAFPGADAPVAVVVYVRDSGITEADRAAVESDRAAFAALSRSGPVEPAQPSADGKALVLAVPIVGDGQAAATAAVRAIKDRHASAPPGLDLAVTGSAGVLADADEAFAGADTTLLLAAAGVVAVLLLITYRSPLLWLVPLVSVGLGSQVATGVVYLLARYAGVTVTETSTGIMVVLVFGVGTDYALLLISRYREELRRRPDRYAAMATAWRRSFPAILASAVTVVVGMLCLLAARMNDVGGLGPIAAAGIATAFAVMTTLLPALLVLLGRWVFWPFVPRYSPDVTPERQHQVWHRLAGAISRRPRPIWVLTTLVLVAATFGVVGFRFGQPADKMYTTEVGSVTGQRVIAAHYPDGASSPARIIAAATATDRILATANATDGIAGATRVGVSADGRWVRVDAVLDDQPDSAAAKATIERLRAAVHALPGADALVGGATATTLDVERSSSRDNRVLLPLILLVVLVVLTVLLRALVAPLLLAAGAVLSFAAAMGLAGLICAAIGYPGITPSMPLWAYLIIVTLGVDYTIFLMTRTREEVAKVGTRTGILSALTVTGGVITSAGVVLAATFATVLLLPVVAALHIGLTVAIGVLLDAFIVRTLLIPALAVDLGDRIWWPVRASRQPGRWPRPPASDRGSPSSSSGGRGWSAARARAGGAGQPPARSR